MAAAKTIVLLYYVMLVLSVTVQAQSRDLQATSSVGNYQLAYDRSVVGGDSLGNLPLDDPRLQRTVQGLAPEQVHLTYVSDTSIIVPWATGASNSTAGPLSRNVLSKATVPASNVMYGTAAGIYTSTASANPSSNTLYTQIYNFSNANPALNYSSPIFHHVTLSNLSASTTYYYKVGDAMYGMSQEFNFTSAPKVQAIPLSWG